MAVSGGASKNSKGAGRSREGEPIVIAMAVTVTVWARGGIPASARGTPGITLRAPPAPVPGVFFNLRLLKQLRLQFF